MSLSITRVGRHRLTRADGTEVSQHTDLKEAYERASAQPAGTYALITADERIVVSGVAPAPVDCAGTWGPWTRVAGSDGPCVNGSRTFTESRIFTVTTPPANGGAACPVSPETRTQTEACVVPPPPPSPDVAALLPTVLNFAEVWRRNWSHGGHSVVVGAGSPPFNENYGFWDYTPTTYEPWLFDRSTVAHRLFEITGDSRWRDVFLSDFAWYRQRIDANGIFTPKGEGDTKYSYVTPFVLYERMTGDAQYRPIAQRIYTAWLSDFNAAANPRTANGWTEREAALALEAAVSWHELTNDPTALVRASAVVANWAAASIDGAPQVTETQHEGGGPAPNALTHSPWMAALYMQSLRRYHARTGDPAAYAQASAWFNWIDQHAFYPGTDAHPEFAGLVFPRYLTDVSGAGIGDSGPDEGHMAHALDILGALRFVAVAQAVRGESLVRVQQRQAEMLATAQRGFANLTRTAAWLPKYRVTPPRMFNWWVRGLYEMARD